MRELRWDSKRDAPVIAAKYGVAAQTVANYASEAGRVVRAAFGPPEEIRSHVAQLLEEAAEDARLAEPGYRCKGLVEVAGMYARIGGLMAPVKIQGAGPVDDLPPEIKKLIRQANEAETQKVKPSLLGEPSCAMLPWHT